MAMFLTTESNFFWKFRNANKNEMSFIEIPLKEG